MLLTQRRDEKSLVCLLAFLLIFDFLTPQSLRNPLDRQGRSMRISDRVNFGFCKCAPVLLSHRTLYLAYCTLCIVRLSDLPAGWSLVAAISRHSGLWSSSTHTRDNCPFLPKNIIILYRTPTFNLAFAFLLINCTMYKASWPWKLVHPHKRHCWVTTVTAGERERGIEREREREM